MSWLRSQLRSKLCGVSAERLQPVTGDLVAGGLWDPAIDLMVEFGLKSSAVLWLRDVVSVLPPLAAKELLNVIFLRDDRFLPSRVRSLDFWWALRRVGHRDVARDLRSVWTEAYCDSWLALVYGLNHKQRHDSDGRSSEVERNLFKYFCTFECTRIHLN